MGSDYLIYIDDFLKAISPIYDIPNSVKANFKQRMHGKWYMKSDEDFMPYFKKFIGDKYKRK